MASREETMGALRVKVDGIFVALDEATRHSTGMERRIEELCRDLNRAMAEGAVAIRAASLEEAPECCPECGGAEMRVVRPPGVAGGGKK